jgi:hypothetical protein
MNIKSLQQFFRGRPLRFTAYILLIVIFLVIITLLLREASVFQKIFSPNPLRENINLLDDVGKHVLLPTTENPQIFMIENPALLVGQQAFFEGAIEGDRLIVYTNMGKAIIYSPARDIIVNMGPVTFDQSASLVADTPVTAS